MNDPVAQEFLPITLQDALDSGAFDVINDSEGQESFALLAALDALMVTKKAAGLTGQAEVAQLLKSCYSMRLDAGSKTEPFQPSLRRSNGNTSAKPYHLPQEHIQLLADAYNQIKPAARRAHLADIVGLMIRKRRIDHVIAAIDAYIVTPLDPDSWFDGGKQHWHRALALALSFRSGIGTRLDQIVNALFSAFEKACEGAMDATPLWYLRPLRAEEIDTHATVTASHLRQLADGHKSQSRYSMAVHMYQAAAYWYSRTDNAEGAAAMLNERAVVTETTADGLLPGLQSQSFYTDALRYYREIDGKYHGALQVRAAIDRVLGKLEAAGMAAISEMQIVRISGPRIDFAEMVESAVSRVRGKSALDALVEFVELDPWPSRTRYLAQAKEVAKVGVMDSIMGSTHLAADGRQIMKVGPLTGDEDKDADVMEMKAIKAFVLYAELTAKVALSPSLSQIYMEHSLSLYDFQVIASECPIVPLSHSDAVAQGLYAGYQRDFVTSLHILLPQFENIVRGLLKNAGVITARTDIDGISMEVGLSTLVADPQMLSTFGPNATFGIKALMCAQVGPNYRNDIAHGLANSGSCHTFIGLYTWWFILKMVFLQWHLARQLTAEGSEEA